MSEDIRGKEMEEIGTETLIRASTIERDEFTEVFLAKARTELEKRDVDLDAARARILILTPDGQSLGTIDDAIESVRSATPWTFRVLEVATGDSLTVNAMAGCWSVSYRDGSDASVGALAFRDVLELESAIRPLLELRPEWREVVGRFQDEKWEVLTTSSSLDHLVAVADELAKGRLLYTLRTASARELEAASWMSIRRDGAQLLIRPDEWSAGKAVLEAIEKEIGEKFAEAEAHADSGDAEAELACYERLARLRPGDAMVHYNRAAILLDLGRREAAAEAFMEATPLLARDENLKPYLSDVSKHLEELMSDYPDPLVVKHALASIAMVTDDIDHARDLYREIVGTDDTDAAAHAALGRIFYEDGDDDAQALEHLSRYLELEPDAPDREAIEQALADLAEGG